MSPHSDYLLSFQSDSSSGATLNGPREGSNISQSHCKIRGEVVQAQGYGYAMPVDMLPDDVLLKIFNSCRIGETYDNYQPQKWVRPWVRLVHVCRRWRHIIFASPHCLHIQLHCTPGVPVRKRLSCWPAFPIIVDYGGDGLAPDDEDNVIAALEHPDRVSRVSLEIKGSQLGKMATVMKEPFPVLTSLMIFSEHGKAPVLPGEFLGGSAPRLQKLWLAGIPFPALPRLLLSASHLVELCLYDIPKTGYISPRAMVLGLSALTSLHSLLIIFRSTKSRPNRISLPPVTRTVLPALVKFEFEGVSDYLEDLVARIDCPKIKWIEIYYPYQFIGFRVAQLFGFINRLEDPRLSHFEWLEVGFSSNGEIDLKVSHTEYDTTIQIFFTGVGWGASHIIQVFGQFSAKLSAVRHLSIYYYRQGPEIGHNEWVQLLHPFTSVQTLRVSRDWVVDPEAPAFEDVTGEMVAEAEVLPALGLLCLNYPRTGCLAFFEHLVAVCPLSGRPVTVTRNKMEFDERLKSYLSEDDKDPYWFLRLYGHAT